MKNTYYTFLVLLASSAALSAITVTTPSNGAQVTSPFSLVASTTTCGSQTAASMGYSLDYGVTTIAKTSFNALVIAGTGQHILHVKCWGTSGAADSSDLNITIVIPPTPAPAPVTVVSNIEDLSTWKLNYDPGTPGSTTGTTAMVTSPSLSGAARQYSMSYSNGGGEIYHVTFGADTKATHFIYDAQIWLDNPADIGNIEMDMNQVIANGDTVIYGVQCDGYTGTWDYTLNTGTRTSPNDTWEHSNVVCPTPKTWTPKVWHHVQISYSRDATGNVTYESVVLDGNQSLFQDATGNSAFALGWGSTLLTNFQIDGFGASGSATAYLDNVTISRW